MRNNLLKEKLNAGGVISGVVLQEPSVLVAEVLGLLGFDFIFIDCEHSAMNAESASRLILGAEVRGITPLVRVPQNSPECILPYLDYGAMGVIIPGMRSLEEATKAIRATKYPPQGQRGLAGVRSADYGLKGALKKYVTEANLQTAVFGIIEDKSGVESIDAILSADGLDGVIIGTNDLSNALGVPGATNHPIVQSAIDRILDAGVRLGKPIGGVVRGNETPHEYTKKGFRILLTSAVGLIAKAGKLFLEGISC
jgi:4-hydroxy-2-oxoheptanedioate aldolase